MSSSLPSRRPWPMKWIVLAILLFIIGYTYLTLHYRKPGRSYEPYADMKERANTGRLLEAGYQRVVLPVEQPADSAPKANTTYPAPGGLPAELKKTIVDFPQLPGQIIDAHAASVAAVAESYRIEFRASTPDDRQMLGGAQMYVKGDSIVITPDFERLPGGLQVRTPVTFAAILIPPHTFKPGTYRVSLIGETASRAWRLDVK